MSKMTINNNQHDKPTNKQTVAVLGAGIIGVNCAAELQSLGYQVTLLDKSDIGFGCSERNAGHFATEQVFPLAESSLLWQMPKLLLDPLGPIALSPKYLPKALPWFFQFINNMRRSHRDKNTQALKNLNRHAIDYYKQLLSAANAEHLLIAQGSLLVFEETPLKDIEKHYQQFVDAKIPVKLLNKEQTLALEPNLSNKINYALYFTDVAHTAEPLKICTVIADFAMSMGTTFKRFQVEKIKTVTLDKNSTDKKIQISGIEVPDIKRATVLNKDKDNNEIDVLKKTLTFDHLVIATGAWSKAILKDLGYHLPLEIERGYSLDLVKGEQAELNRPVASSERKFIMTPMAHGLRLSGTVEFAGLEQEANMDRADMLFVHAKQMLTTHAEFDKKTADENQRWLGFRPSLPDSLPVICRAPKQSNIFFALGHQHLGLTLGAITGKLIGQIITDRKTDIDISPFCISRFN